MVAGNRVAADLALVARGDDAKVRMWDLQTGGRLLVNTEQHEASIGFVDVSPDGETLLTVDEHRFRLWSAKSGQPLRTVQLPRPNRSVRNLMQASFTPDGRSVLICGGVYEPTGDFRRGTVEVWDVATGELRIDFGELPWYATAASFSEDGKTAAVYCGYGSATRNPKNEVFVFRLQDGQILQRLESAGSFGELYVLDLRIRNEGTIVDTLQYDSTMIAWDMDAEQRGEPKQLQELGATGDLRITPDQQRVLSSDYKQKNTQAVRLANVKRRSRVRYPRACRGHNPVLVER